MTRPLTKEEKALIDEYGELKRQAVAFKPTKDRLDSLGDVIAGWYKDAPAEASFLAQGDRYDLQIGPKANERQITNMDRLFQLLGRARFLLHATFPLKQVDAGIPKAQHGLFLVEDRTGSRKLTPVARAPQVAERKKKAA